MGIYACGPTVYDRIHVGNARPYVVFSVLARFLAHEGYEPKFVANVTDINDKIYVAARAAGVPSDELAAEMTAAYVADTDALGLGRPDAEPLASGTIDGIVELIGALIDRGHAYAADGDVYFSVRSFDGYGELSHRPVVGMDQGEDAGDDAKKRDPLDFALWKGEKPDEDTAWDSPWGRGRPGWHIECSAMAEAELGLDFAIHGGGSDLVFPHHENELAQTAAGRGQDLAKIWMHNGMVRCRRGEDGQVGREHLQPARGDRRPRPRRDRPLLRRGPLPPAGGILQRRACEAAAAHARRFVEVGRRLVPGPSPAEWAPHKEAFFAALADDFNTPAALAAADAWVREANRAGGAPGDADLREMLGVLGLENLLDGDAGADGPDGRAERPHARARACARGEGLRRGRSPARRARRARLAGPRLGRGPEPRADRAVVVLYGRNPVHEALRGPAPGPPGLGDAERRPRARGRAGRGRRRPRRSSAAAARRPTRASAPRSIPTPTSAGEELLAGDAPFVLALDGIEDPQNLGALCRTAECAGVDGVVIPERRAAEVTPAVCKASAGAVEHLAIARVRNLADFLADAKDRGCWCYGAAADAPRGPGDIDFKGGLVLVLGAEGRGLRDRVAAMCDDTVSLPMRGRIGSLNASAAGAVLLYAALHDSLHP